MRTMQMGNLTRPLAGEQDHLQWCAEVGPERSNLGVTSTRSRLAVPFFSTPEHGFAAMISWRMAQLKIGLAAASTWFARTGLVVFA